MARKPASRNTPAATQPAAPTTTQQDAIHPHWNSVLLFTMPGNRVRHLHHGSTGIFARSGNDITVTWDAFPADHFTDIDGLLVHQTLLGTVADINDARAVRIGTHLFRLTRVQARVLGSEHDVELRLFSSDIPTFHQIFAARDYASPDLPETARSIVDLGANIGLASVFFALRYPDARIIAVEPDADNFAALVRNTARFWPRIAAREGAVWTHDGEISLRREDAHGQPLGAWGVQVAPDTASGIRTACYTLPTLMQMANFPDIDILKCDIEGAEAELLTAGATAWLPKIGLIIIEFHDGIHPGSEARIRAVLAPLFEELPPRGENFYFRRRDASG